MQCAIVRDALAKGPRCDCTGADLPQCRVGGVLMTSPPASCKVLDLAATRDQYFQTQYSPLDLASSDGKVTRDATLRDLGYAIAKSEAELRQAYGADAPVGAISYWRMQQCLADESGRRVAGRKYLGREDLVRDGNYAGKPLLGGAALAGRMPAGLVRMVPVLGDRLMGPELLLLVILLVLVGISWGLAASVARQGRGAYRRSLEARLAAARRAPPAGGPAAAALVVDKQRAKVFDYEAQGYCMRDYRKKLGMPPGQACA